MDSEKHIAGILILILVIAGVQVLVFIRTVSSIKSRILDLKRLREEADSSGKLSAEFQKAYSMLDQVQREKLLMLRQTVWGRLFGHIFSPSTHETPKY